MAFNIGTNSLNHKKMEELGVKEGGLLKPDTYADSPDLHEVKAILQAKQMLSVEEGNRTDQLVNAEKKISEISQKIDSIEAACNSNLEHDLLESAFKSSLSKNEDVLISTCAKELEERASLNSYKTRNNINVTASYPPDPLFHFALLVVFVVAETVVNAFFFQGSSGLLGGAVVAMSVSVVNMSIAAFLGAGYRYVNLSDSTSKIKGYLSLTTFIIMALVMNLIFSTFRVQFELLQQQVVQQNMDAPTTAMLVGSFKTAVGDAFNVFLLKFPEVDVMSFILFFVGVICSLLAFWKGYTFDDKHPGYGEIDRKHKKAEKDFNDAKNDAFNAAVSKVHQVADEVDELRNSLIASQRNSHALKAQVQSIQATFEGSLKKIQGELNLAIEAYRGANKATRTTPPPKYFEIMPLLAPDSNDDKTEELIYLIDQLSLRSKKITDEKVELLGNRLQEIRSKIHQLVQHEFQLYMNNIRQSATIALNQHGQIKMVA